MTSHRRLFVGAIFVLLAGCGANGGTDEIVSGVPIGSSETIPVIDSVPDPATDDPETSPTSSTALGSDEVRLVESFADMSGIWMPTEVNGQPVDAAALGAYIQITGTESSARVVGYDGCNRIGGRSVGDGPLLDEGRLVDFESESTMQDCDESIRVDFHSDALLSMSGDGTELFADGLPVVGSIRYERVESVPVDPRVAIRQAEQEEEDAERIAEEQAEADAFERTRDEARAQIRTELPEARARWAESGIESYTLRFENGSLMNDPSFPTGRPVSGVWEIEVVDGVALENEWSDSILGDTVEDWFAYVESQLDSYYLDVAFDPDSGFPSTIDSQPLDDRVVEDPNSVVAWIVFAEVEPTA